MLVIRLSRVGRKKTALYRLVAADKRRAATGKVVARLGHYNPHTKEAVINKEAIEDYLSKGAQPSSSAVKLLKAQKVKLPKWAEANLIVKKKQPKKKEEKAEATPKPAKPDEAASEAPKGEAKSDQKAEATEDKKAEKNSEATTVAPDEKAEKSEDKPEVESPKEEKPAEAETKAK